MAPSAPVVVCGLPPGARSHYRRTLPRDTLAEAGLGQGPPGLDSHYSLPASSEGSTPRALAGALRPWRSVALLVFLEPAVRRPDLSIGTPRGAQILSSKVYHVHNR